MNENADCNIYPCAFSFARFRKMESLLQIFLGALKHRVKSKFREWCQLCFVWCIKACRIILMAGIGSMLNFGFCYCHVLLYYRVFLSYHDIYVYILLYFDYYKLVLAMWENLGSTRLWHAWSCDQSTCRSCMGCINIHVRWQQRMTSNVQILQS